MRITTDENGFLALRLRGEPHRIYELSEDFDGFHLLALDEDDLEYGPEPAPSPAFLEAMAKIEELGRHLAAMRAADAAAELAASPSQDSDVEPRPARIA